MRTAFLALALVLSPACAHSQCALTPIGNVEPLSGDYDGDGRRDSAGFFEDESGSLVVVVRRAVRPTQDITIWGGDITALERFEIRNAPPGAYHTDCEAYGGCGAPPPENVTLTHDGIIVREVDGPWRTLYFWDGAAFQNVSMRD